MGPVKIMKYNHEFDTVISADSRGIIEYWSPATLKFPEDEYVIFSPKSDGHEKQPLSFSLLIVK